ncbi:hypothetical protein IKE79_00255 [Candidatus Saccharibacteria bacterium]|nr:hypothetical protein [Candidatus Saccharibacteria bacterium]
MRNYAKTKLFETLVNKTNRTIRKYDESSGRILVFDPSDAPIPKKPVFYDKEHHQNLVGYVVEPELCEKLKQSGRALDDIVMVSDVAVGRGGRTIAELVWARGNQKTPVRLFLGLRMFSLAHL